MNQIMNDCLVSLNRVGSIFYSHAVNAFIQSALLVIALFVLDVLLRKRVRAIFRYWVWLLVLVKLVLPPSLSLPTGIGYWVGEGLPAAARISRPAWDVKEFEHGTSYASQGSERSADMSEAESTQTCTRTEARTTPDVPVTVRITWQAVLFLLWILGVCIFLVLLTRRARYVRAVIATSRPADEGIHRLLEQCRQQLGCRGNISLRVSETMPSPAVCGFLRPIVLIPMALLEKLSSKGLRSALIHEIAHIKRRDLLVHSVQTLIQIVYFYNPFVWFANAIIRRVCEEAVDETVLVTLGDQAEDYSDTLIDISEIVSWRTSLGLRLVSVAESKKALQWRIRHMLTRPLPKSARVGVFGTIVIIIIAAVLLPMARAEKSDKGDMTVEKSGEVESIQSVALLGEVAKVKAFLDKGIDVNEKNHAGMTALHAAATGGHKEIAELLIGKGADANAKGFAMQTPLHNAASEGHQALVELLLAHGANVNSGDLYYNRTPAEFAMGSGHVEVVTLLMSKGANISTLNFALYIEDPAEAKRLIENGANVNEPTPYGTSPLHRAVTKGFQDVAELLIEKGANVNAKDNWNWTPLHSAIYISKDMVQLLIDSGADVNAKDNSGMTPGGYAEKEGDSEIVDLFRKHGARQDAPDTERATDITMRRVMKGRRRLSRISPDGKYFCYVGSGDLNVYEPATGQQRVLVPGGLNQAVPSIAISPDSKMVAYHRNYNNLQVMQIIGLDGSGGRTLISGKRGFVLVILPRDWSADGKRILGIRPDVKDIVWVSTDDGSIHTVTSLSNDRNPMYGTLDLSPDDRYIAYAARDRRKGVVEYDIFLLDTHDKSETRLEHPANDRLFGWTPDGKHILFASDRKGTWDLWLQGITNGKPDGSPMLIRRNVGQLNPLGLTKSGACCYGTTFSWSTLYTATLEIETGRMSSSPKTMTQGENLGAEVWSPAGEHLAYCVYSNDGSSTIHIRSLATDMERVIETDLPWVSCLSWTPTGQSLIASGLSPGGGGSTGTDLIRSVYQIDVETGEKNVLFKSAVGGPRRAEFSPDGKTLVYMVRDPHKGYLFVRDLETGRERNIFESDWRASWDLSPDGKSVAIRVPTTAIRSPQQLKIISLEGKELAELLPKGWGEIRNVLWTPDGKTLLFTTQDVLWKISAEGGEPVKLLPTSELATGHVFDFSLHPDGRQIAFDGITGTGEVWIMDNFLSAGEGK